MMSNAQTQLLIVRLTTYSSSMAGPLITHSEYHYQHAFRTCCGIISEIPAKHASWFTPKNHQLVAMLIKTGCNNSVLRLFITVVNNIVQHCLRWTISFSVVNTCSTILLQAVVQQAHNFWLCIVVVSKGKKGNRPFLIVCSINNNLLNY